MLQISSTTLKAGEKLGKFDEGYGNGQKEGNTGAL